MRIEMCAYICMLRHVYRLVRIHMCIDMRTEMRAGGHGKGGEPGEEKEHEAHGTDRLI